MFAVVKPLWTAGWFSQSGSLDDGALGCEGPRTLRKCEGKLGWV